MRQRRLAIGVGALALAVAGCGGADRGGDRADPTTPATQAGGGAACAERLTFSETAWEAAPTSSPAATPGTVQWQARFTFANPNPFEVRLTDAVIVLEILTSDGHHGSTGRTSFREAAAATIASRASLEKVATAWMRDNKIPETTQLYVTTAATVAGATCAVPVERVSTTPPSPQVFTLPDCGSESC